MASVSKTIVTRLSCLDCRQTVQINLWKIQNLPITLSTTPLLEFLNIAILMAPGQNHPYHLYAMKNISRLVIVGLFAAFAAQSIAALKIPRKVFKIDKLEEAKKEAVNNPPPLIS